MVVFATIALGMGVNLSQVIHYGAPTSVDDYFCIRGGCSGKVAESVVLWKPRDFPVKKEATSTRDHVCQFQFDDNKCLS